MFHLVKGLYENYNKRQEYSILVLGLENSGKTTLLEKLKELYFVPTKNHIAYKSPLKILPTNGQNIGYIRYNDKMTFKIWDLAGQEEFRTMWPTYFSSAHGIILLIDSSDKEKLEECQKEFITILSPDELLECSKNNNNNNNNNNNSNNSNYDDDDESKYVDPSIPILMLANKQDVEGALEVEDIKNIFNKIAEQLDARDSRVLPVSALTGEGVKDAMEWMSIRLDRNKINRPPNYK